MANITSLSVGALLLTGKQPNARNTSSNDSLFLETLKGLSGALQTMASDTDSIVRLKDATLTLSPPGESPSLLGNVLDTESMTVSGDVTETSEHNGHSLTQTVPISFTESAPGQTTAQPIGSPLPSETNNQSLTKEDTVQTNNEPQLTVAYNPGIKISGVASSNLSEVSAFFPKERVQGLLIGIEQI